MECPTDGLVSRVPEEVRKQILKFMDDTTQDSEAFNGIKKHKDLIAAANKEMRMWPKQGRIS